MKTLDIRLTDPKPKYLFSMAETAAALKHAGYLVSRAFLVRMVEAGEGPLVRTTPKHPEPRIRWADAREWAELQRTLDQQLIKGDPPVAKEDVGDLLAQFIRGHYPDVWAKFCCLPGPQRKNTLIQVTDLAIALVRFQFDEIGQK